MAGSPRKGNPAPSRPIFSAFMGHRHALARWRGLPTKIHARVDGKGRPVRLLISPGNDHDITCAEALLGGLEPGATVIAEDKGYDVDSVRTRMREQRARCQHPQLHQSQAEISLEQSDLPPAQPGRALLQQAEAVQTYTNPLRQARRHVLRLHPACLHPHLLAIN